MALLRSRFKTYPDSATVWQDVAGQDGSAVTGGTYLYQWDDTGANPPALDFSQSPQPHLIYRVPLTSGALASRVVNPANNDASQYTATLADFNLVNPSKGFTDPENTIDLNHARFPNDTTGWIGSLPGENRRAFRVPWVELKDTSDPANPKVIARYAFWVEDESFRLNVNCAKATPRGTDSVGADASEIPLQGLLANGDISEDPQYDQLAKDVQTTRDALLGKRFFEFSALNQIAPPVAEPLKFEGTVFSGCLNLARSGALRLDINQVVQNNPNAPANPTAVTIRSRLDQMIKAIAMQLPNFGQRFYRLDGDLNANEVTPLHQTAYLQKIAANIHDYIDTDSNPTIVANDPSQNYPVVMGKQTTGAGALSGTSGPINWIAIGKENVPYLQEYAIRADLKQLNPPVASAPGGSSHYEFYLDYYFEFWNMTNRDITFNDLGPNPVLRIYNQPGFDTGAGGTPIDVDRPFELPIAPQAGLSGTSVAFPAGQVTVLTTDLNLNPSSPPAFLPAGANIVVLRPPPEMPDSYRHYQGTTYKTALALTDARRAYGYRVDLIGRYGSGRTQSDYQTAMLIENDNGVLESFSALPVARLAGAFGSPLGLGNAFYRTASRIDNDHYFARGGSLHGNIGMTGLAVTGDPRTNNEQLAILPHTHHSNADETRYLNTMDNNRIPGDSTIGALDTNFVDETLWPDRNSNTAGPSNAPMAIADAPLKSIGELGNIFDPVREIGSSGKIEYSRGGGRTLTVGQPDPLWDKNPASPSHEWAAWRLTDIFCTGTASQLEGSININGVLRDNGAALKAALYGFQFGANPGSDPSWAGQPLDQATVDAMIQQIADRLKGTAQTPSGGTALAQGPFFERGELSELPIFAPGPGRINGADTSKVNDRGREELFRRLVDLTTTKGNVFTVYAIGQAIQQTANGKKRVAATSQMKVTFRLAPRWRAYANGEPPATFDPSDGVAVKNRFSPPDFYDVQILQVSDP